LENKEFAGVKIKIFMRNFLKKEKKY